MTEQEMFIHVYAGIMRGYASRNTAFLSLSNDDKAKLLELVKITATHAVESSREFLGFTTP